MNSQDSYEVIIIGAGSVGTPTALFWLKLVLKFWVIDRNPSSG